MRTFLEIFLCSSDGEAVWYHRCFWDVSGCGEDPDKQIATRLATTIPKLVDYRQVYGEEGCCTHSTSWRFVDGGIVLTYIMLLPLELLVLLPLISLRPQGVAPARAAGALSPRPLAIAEEQVLAHGLGHLRYLALERGEPYVAATAHRHGVMPVLSRFTSTLAGRLDQYL